MFRHCLMPVPKTGPLRNIGDYFPAVCTESPVHNSGFCGEHTDLIQSLGLPTKVQSFITYCGADPKNFTTKEKAKVKQVLRTIVENQDSQIHVPTSEEDQGIEFLLENEDISSTANLKSEEEVSGCNKNTGITQRLYNWSRGIFQIVAGSGHIETWAPIYEHESPHQSAFLMIKYLTMKLEGKNEEDYRNFFISYDSMCSIDNLKLLRKPLPLPPPQDKIWAFTNHLVDPLHLRNHKSELCQERYNSDLLKERMPNTSLMICEETFAWQSRLNRIMCSQTKTTFLFTMHRLVKARNAYIAFCYKDGKRPVGPSSRYSDK